MGNNEYFFDGNRIKLDTRMIERVGSVPTEAALRKRQLEARKRQVDRAWTGAKLLVCAFSGWFAFNHALIFVKHGLLALEMIGVIASVGFIAVTISEAIDKRIEAERKEEV